MNSYNICALKSALAISALLVAGCGGGGGGGASDSTSASNTANTTSNSTATSDTGNFSIVSGSIVKGPVLNATVCAYTLVATGMGSKIGCTTTKSDGSYVLELNYSGPLVVEATGGTYTDEATGVPGVALSAPLSTMGTVASGTNTLMATPLTTIAFNQAAAGGSLTVPSFEAAARQVKTVFGLGDEVDLARTLPSVAIGSTNTYGSALIGVSKMLRGGASLAGVVTSTSLAGLGVSFQACSATPVGAASASPTVSGAITSTTTTLTPTFVSINVQVSINPDVASSGPATRIDVTNPFGLWRETLPSTGRINQTACTVTGNTATNVSLSCAQSSAISTLQMFAGGSASGQLFYSSPVSSSLLVLAGEKISITGGALRTSASALVSINSGSGALVSLLGSENAVNSNLILNTCQLLPTGVMSGKVVLNPGTSGTVTAGAGAYSGISPSSGTLTSVPAQASTGNNTVVGNVATSNTLSASSNNAATVQANTTVIGSTNSIMGTTLVGSTTSAAVTGITSSAATANAGANMGTSTANSAAVANAVGSNTIISATAGTGVTGSANSITASVGANMPISFGANTLTAAANANTGSITSTLTGNSASLSSTANVSNTLGSAGWGGGTVAGAVIVNTVTVNTISFSISP